MLLPANLLLASPYDFLTSESGGRQDRLPQSGKNLLGAFLDDPVSSYSPRSDFTQLKRMARTTANDAHSAMMTSALVQPPRRSPRAMTPLVPLTHGHAGSIQLQYAQRGCELIPGRQPRCWWHASTISLKSLGRPGEKHSEQFRIHSRRAARARALNQWAGGGGAPNSVRRLADADAANSACVPPTLCWMACTFRSGATARQRPGK
jgi:hypothetical protein